MEIMMKNNWLKKKKNKYRMMDQPTTIIIIQWTWDRIMSCALPNTQKHVRTHITNAHIHTKRTHKNQNFQQSCYMQTNNQKRKRRNKTKTIDRKLLKFEHIVIASLCLDESLAHVCISISLQNLSVFLSMCVKSKNWTFAVGWPIIKSNHYLKIIYSFFSIYI